MDRPAKHKWVAITLAALLGLTVYTDIAAASTAQQKVTPLVWEGTLWPMPGPMACDEGEEVSPGLFECSSDTYTERSDHPFASGSRYVVARYEVPPGHRIDFDLNFLDGTPLDLYVVESRDFDAFTTGMYSLPGPLFSPTEWNDTNVYLHVPAHAYPARNNTSGHITAFPDPVPWVVPGPFAVERPAANSLPEHDARPPAANQLQGPDGTMLVPSVAPPMQAGTVLDPEGLVFLWLGHDENMSAYEPHIERGIAHMTTTPLEVTDVGREDARTAFLVAEGVLGAGTLAAVVLALRSRPAGQTIQPVGWEESLLDLMERAGGYLQGLRTALWLTGTLLAWAALSTFMLAGPFIAKGSEVHGAAYGAVAYAAMTVVFVGAWSLWAHSMWATHRELLRWGRIQHTTS